MSRFSSSAKEGLIDMKHKNLGVFLVEIGQPEQEPRRYIEPIKDPIKRDNPTPVKPTVSPKPEREPVPA